MHVKQDFKQAAYWFTQSAHKGHNQALYSLGYLFYKGLGVPQDYRKAVHFFNLSAEKDNPNGLMMLGLCYKMGYGLPQSPEAANFFLNKSKEIKNSYQVKSAIYTDAENNQRVASDQELRLDVRRDLQKYISERSYKNIDKKNTELSMEGDWEGKVLVYDWGGTRVIEEYKANLSLKVSSDGVLVGNMNLNDTIETPIRATMSENELAFTEGGFSKKEWYSETEINYSLKNAYFDIISDESDKIVISANLNLKAEDFQEPANPYFLVLIKDKSTSLDFYDSNINVYPNPFDSHINIEFQNVNEGAVKITLVDMSGRNVSTLYNDYLSKGLHKLEYDLSLNPGVYLMNFSGENRKYAHKIIVVH